MIWSLFKFLGQELSNFFVGILVETMTPKGHFEISWPLVLSKGPLNVKERSWLILFITDWLTPLQTCCHFLSHNYFLSIYLELTSNFLLSGLFSRTRSAISGSTILAFLGRWVSGTTMTPTSASLVPSKVATFRYSRDSTSSVTFNLWKNELWKVSQLISLLQILHTVFP